MIEKEIIMKWVVVITRISDGHVHEVKGYKYREDAIQAVVNDYKEERVSYKLDSFGEFTLDDTRISVLEVSN
jgi:hypothetical protein